MTRKVLIERIQERRKAIGITYDNLAKLTGLSLRTVNRFFAGEDVKLSTVERITSLLGLDFSGNETIPLETLQKQRAYKKALFLASLVQGTSTLEIQGLEKPELEKMIHRFEEELLHGEYRDQLWVA